MLNHTQKTNSIVIYIALFVISVALSLVAISLSSRTSALAGSEFNPGRIIDDSVFYNSNSMSSNEIQQFLNSKVPVCDTNGTGAAVGFNSSMTRAQYANYMYTNQIGNNWQYWHSPPYTCLKDHRQDTPQMEAASGLCASIPAKTNNSSSQIIKDVSVACGINPQVLIILLEKEQSLVTDIWPLQNQFTKATGFACPDTAPCNPAYNGFFYQVYHAARQFKVYQKNPGNYNYVSGRVNRIYWQTNLGNFVNPTGNANDPSRAGQSACGYQNVYIQNQATAALYIYTPYQPNQSALNNLRGTGDACSAYGNRNFWRLFNDWFGSTLSTFTPVSNITLAEGTYSILNKSTGKALDVTNASKSNGARLQVWDHNWTIAQHWVISRDTDNYYTIKNVNSGKVLDVANGSTAAGAKIQIWDGNGTCAQKWAAISVNGSVAFLNKCSGLAIDIAGGNAFSGAAIQAWHANSSGAQTWTLHSHSAGPINTGLYQIKTVSNLALETNGGSTANGARVQISAQSSAPNQVWHVTYHKNGYYSIRNAETGRLFDVAGASTANGASIQILDLNASTCAQRWIANGNDTTGYTLQSSCSNKVLDVQGGAINTPGAPIQLWDNNGTGAQKWHFTKHTSSIPNATYSLLTATGAAIDMTNGQVSNGTPLQLWSKNGSGAQVWRVTKQADNSYSIVNTASGRYLDVRNASFANGTRMQIWNSNDSCAQRWNLIPKNDGKYEVLSACSNSWAIDVSGGRISSAGAAIQLYGRNGSGAQVWTLSTPW